VDGRDADLLLRQMHLKTAKVLARGGVRRTAEEGREGPDVPDVILLHLLLETARRHVVDHALTQRPDGLVEHRESSCLASGLNPTILRQSEPSRCPGPGAPKHLPLAASTARAV